MILNEFWKQEHHKLVVYEHIIPNNVSSFRTIRGPLDGVQSVPKIESYVS